MSRWVALMIRGVLAILFGIAALLVPGATLLTLVLLFAAYAAIDGVMAIVMAFRAAEGHGRVWPFVIEGVLNLAAAAIAVLWPGVTVIVFTAIVAAWAILSGIAMLVGAFRLRVEHGDWLLILSGILSILLGVTFIVFPVAAALTLAWMIGAFAFAFGVTLVMVALRLRGRGASRGGLHRPA